MTLDAKGFYNKFTDKLTLNGNYIRYSLLSSFTSSVKRAVSEIING